MQGNVDAPYVVVGAGAIGGTVAACLCQAGHAVHLVDSDTDHVRAVADGGLRVVGGPRPLHVRPTVSTPEGYEGDLHRVLLAVKSPATRVAARWIAPRLTPDGYVVSLQNGMCEPRIAEIVGPDRTVGAFVNLFADRTAPGEVTYGGGGALVIGEFYGDTAPSERVTRLAEDLRAVGARTSDNVAGYLWAKLGYFAMLASTALDDVPMAATIGGHSDTMIALAGEVYAVALAKGVRLAGFDAIDSASLVPGTPRDRAAGAVSRIVEWMAAQPKQHGGIWRDIVVRKQKTEVSDQLDPVRELAAHQGISTPALDELALQIREVEAGGPRGAHRLRRLSERAGVASR